MAVALPGDGPGRRTLVRRWPFRRLLPAAAGLALLAAVEDGAAAASSSSGSVEILVSVATRYRVAIELPAAAGAWQVDRSGELCLATNSLAPTMPVALTWSPEPMPILGGPASDAGHGPAAARISSCGLIAAKLKLDGRALISPGTGGLLLVRPE